MQSELLVEQDGGIVTITINRPERRNALTDSVIGGMRRAIVEAGENDAARVIVITGAGDKAFCAGADLTPGDTPFDTGSSRETLPYADLLRAGKACRLPIVGGVNGACVAGGMGLLGICDVAVAVADARFGLPEVKVGIFPMQVLSVLQDLVHPRALAELCYTGRLIGAEEALALGLVNQVVAAGDFRSAVAEMASSIAEASPVAVRRGKYALRAMRGMSFEQMIAFAETQVGPMAMTEDAREGIAAFNERRKPIWPNR